MTARSAHSTATGTSAAVAELVEQLGPGPHTIVFYFAAPGHDIAGMGAALGAALGGIPAVGCSTAGELSNMRSAMGGVSAMAFSTPQVRRCATALAEYDDDNVEASVGAAVARLEASLGRPLRDLDPRRYVGVVLIEGQFSSEERVNAALGSAAPFLSFVGGSAGADDFGQPTTCAVDGRTSRRGCALAVLELGVPYSVLKTCHYAPVVGPMTATRAEGRMLHELDGQPAANTYAAALGVPLPELTISMIVAHPLGLMIDGQPWLRQPGAVVPGTGALVIMCGVAEDSELYVMRSAGQLVEGTAGAIERVKPDVGGEISAALLFNCVGRRMEMDALGLHERFVDLLKFPAAGFHTYGESWLGHMNQTLTGLVFG